MRTYRLRHPSGPSMDISADHVSTAVRVFQDAYPHLDEDGLTATIVLKSGLEVNWDTGEVSNFPELPIRLIFRDTMMAFFTEYAALEWLMEQAAELALTGLNWPGATMWDTEHDVRYTVSHLGEAVLLPPSEDITTWN